MKSRKDAVEFCLKFPDSYEDYPFKDHNWTVIRHKSNNKIFAWIFERNGHIWINLKARPEWCDLWRNTYASVIPGYHLNKNHWNSVILDDSVPEDKIEIMIADSYELTRINHQN